MSHIRYDFYPTLGQAMLLELVCVRRPNECVFRSMDDYCRVQVLTDVIVWLLVLIFLNNTGEEASYFRFDHAFD